ncbi:MAG: GNAT family N-acetyltransferase [Clostridia bacterium]|nr:GNAT family N-acetyltransferase [Clostridia bacterium]
MEHEIKIRKAEICDIDQIMQIWKVENINAHNFISPDYWKENFCAVKNALPQADIYVSVCKGDITGFIGLNGNYIEGLFIKSSLHRQGIGRALLNKVKALKSELTLNVYKKNVSAVNFYLKNNFTITRENLDTQTNEIEYTMLWKKD